MGVSRRTMLAGAAAVSGVAAVVGVGNCGDAPPPATYEGALAAILGHFDYLNVPEATVRQFLDAHRSHKRRWPVRNGTGPTCSPAS